MSHDKEKKKQDTRTWSAQTHLPEAFCGTSSVVYSHSGELIESDNEFTKAVFNKRQILSL